VIPTTWSELLGRLSRRLPGGRAEAEDWLQEAVEARYGTASLHDLDRAGRQRAFQKSAGVLLAVEDGDAYHDPLELRNADGDLLWIVWRDGTIEPPGDYQPGYRDRMRAVIARYWDGVAVDGPPWRLTPYEADRPTWEEWSAPADFAGV
jgi:hypothetical protein